MSDTPRKRDQSENRSSVSATFQDRFDRQAADIVQELALNGESFNRMSYVRERIAAALRVLASSTTVHVETVGETIVDGWFTLPDGTKVKGPCTGMALVPLEPTDEMAAEGSRAWSEKPQNSPTDRWSRAVKRVYRAMVTARPQR